MKNLKFSIFSTAILFAFLNINSCSNNQKSKITKDDVEISVDKSLFLQGGLASPITIVSRTLSDGSTADCYKIVVKSIPVDHQMGPWCPTNISDDASKGGIWMEGGKVYDVDGDFVKNLATFYKDSSWMMYDKTTGKITKTSSKKECEEAANPNVGPQYKNFCVECLPSYVSTLTHTYYIPVSPKKAVKAYSFGNFGGRPGGGGPNGPRPNGPRPNGPPPEGGRPEDGHNSQNSMPSSRGLAFNGVVFDAPAPTDRILEAYTLAPFDDAGGHINLAAGYHYHAATGVSTKISQKDGHASMIGYAMDGYGIFENKDSNGKEYADLDASRGHYDAIRGYHYHVDKAGNNNFINGLRGEYAN
ncbi:YHYH protein [Frigoriflavimonas asaccharolytica]|uniref:YHYH domain-containing protein n=1 Tax=Frigoriflavimonas asaccharolytica TaxID=2735899 RepID=A0A8J8G6D8_9FLAO|nr:YHYH protein [Frigoriflavimonas asaccharolytica]NRS92094.1 hypothetical protein [Frigoriflavimonas asaccharolytica]